SSLSRFGDPIYAFEELIAELGSAFLCAELGVYGEVQHESYFASWLKTLKEDKHAIFRASRQAREACEFLLNLAQDVRRSVA
ncbi:zincin-like metallopeptidase domain-containing protein, partial [Klebsiella pneumoniae]